MIYLIIIITILLGTSLSSHSIELLPFYCGYYVVSFFILRSFDYGQDYYLSFHQRVAAKTENKLLVAGNEMIFDVESDKQEVRFLNLFDPKKVVKRKFLNGIIFIGGLWFFYSKLGAEISPSTLIPLLGCAFVMYSFYVGHLLGVLLLNSAVVIYNYSATVPVLYYLLYLSLFLSSLYLVSNHKGSFQGRKIVSLISLALFFMLSSYGFSWIIPKNSTPLDQRNKLSRNESKALNDFVLKNKDELLKLKEKFSNSSKENDISDTIGKSLSEIDSLQKVFKKNDFTHQEKRKLLKRMQKFTDQQQSLNQKIGGQGTPDLNKISLSPKEQDVMNGMRTSQERELTKEEKDVIQNVLVRGKGAGSSTKEIQAISKLLEQKEISEADRKKMKEGLENIARGAPSQKKLEIPSLKEKEEIFKPLKNKTESNRLMERLKRFAPFIIGTLLFFLINYFLRKKEVKKVEAFDPIALNELKAEWKALRKLTLSPRDEVIHYYHLFHVSLQKIHYPTHEAPPSCIIYDDMKKNNLELDKPTLVITEVFAQCYYGEMDVTTDALKMFRKALGKILTVYQLN